jgi:signal transduction histidine kinase
MPESSYLRLIYLTAGTLLPFFWMVVILGHRRQRSLERIFFFLCLSLVCFFGSSLLALNAHLYYGTPPKTLQSFAWTFLCLGLWFVPPLLVHLHVEYASLRGLVENGTSKMFWLLGAYVPAFLLTPKLLTAFRPKEGTDFKAPSHQLGIAFQIWLVLAISAAAFWQWKFSKVPRDKQEKALFRGLQWDFIALAIFLSIFMFMQYRQGTGAVSGLEWLLAILVLGPFISMIREVQRFNFLDIGRQRNLIYAVFMVFLALLYLSLVRRTSQWLEPYFPPEASAALLLFLPVVFFEPLQRLMRRLLRQTAQTEVDRAQKLMGPINEVARLGDLGKLREFSERWIAEQLQLADVKLELDAAGATPRTAEPGKGSSAETFEIRRAGQHLGSLGVRSHGAMISGETYAALEFLCEQLPAAFDLCRLIEEKLQLERELAERERMALVGQMAASISHNLKNPLGSMKTILQVQMESPDLPAAMRHETQMVLDEINRLSARLNQLLQFSRPGVSFGQVLQTCDLATVAGNIVAVLRRDAENRGVTLDLIQADEGMMVGASSEVASDILSNIVLNALEAVPQGGHVRLELRAERADCTITVEDDGPGISPALKDKILQPFFTTKARGTGLGLAIVQRRLEEVNGSIAWESPVQDGRGTRFLLSLPLVSNNSAPEKL